MATRRELIQAISERYKAAARSEKKKILDEFLEVTGFHRKRAIRALRKASANEISKQPAARSEPVRFAPVDANLPANQDSLPVELVLALATGRASRQAPMRRPYEPC